MFIRLFSTRFECVFECNSPNAKHFLSYRILDTSNNPSVQFSPPKTTLETSGEDVKLDSKRVEKMQNYTRNEWRRLTF
jgi:hypothetical protein